MYILSPDTLVNCTRYDVNWRVGSFDAMMQCAHQVHVWVKDNPKVLLNKGFHRERTWSIYVLPGHDAEIVEFTLKFADQVRVTANQSDWVKKLRVSAEK